MALSKISSYQAQLQPNTTEQIPIIGSVPISSVEVRKVGSLDNQLTDAIVRRNVGTDKCFTVKLLNYVEPINIFGVNKTVFFTELSANFKVGDRLFILNGNYDSDDYIKKDKYTRYTDGYRVLGVDGCKIILDIDFTGQLPYTNFNLDDLFFVHNISTQEQFDLINSSRMGITQSSSSRIISIFEFSSSSNIPNVGTMYGRNIAFISQQFNGSSEALNFSTTMSFVNPGFYCKTGDEWINVTEYWNSNNFKDGNPSTNNSGFFTPEKMLILGEDFTFNGQIFGERQVYRFDSKAYDSDRNVYGKWVFDKSYKQPLISKLHFRYGNFSGTHNDGIFGSYDKLNKWENSSWNSGILVNTDWLSGNMRSKPKTERSFSAKLQTGGGLISNNIEKVLQNFDLTNNRGFGYNYIIDSTIITGSIEKGNFENSNLGIATSSNIIEGYLSKKDNYSIKIDSASLNFCNIYNAMISNSSLAENILENTTLINTKLLNNQIIDSVIDRSQYSSNSGILIIGADIWSSFYGGEIKYDEPEEFDKIIGTIKLYISDNDFLKLEKGDSFFIEKINKEVFLTSLTEEQKILIPFENTFLIDIFNHYELCENPGEKIKIAVSIKPKTSNHIRYFVESKKTQTSKIFLQPNTGVYWQKINSSYGGNWEQDLSPEGEFFVKYTYTGDLERFYRWTGEVSDNEEPENPTQSNPWAWEPLNVVEIWENGKTYSSGTYVLADDIKTGTFSFYESLSDNYDGSGGYIDASSTSRTIPSDVFERKISFENNQAKYCSIDIESEAFGWFNNLETNKKQYSKFNSDKKSGISKIPIDSFSSTFINNYIKLSDFRSGLFLNSTWQSGSNISYYSNIIQNQNQKTLRISGNANSLIVNIIDAPYRTNKRIKGFDITVGDSVWLSGVSRVSGTVSENITGRYQVTAVSRGGNQITINPAGFTLSTVTSPIYSVIGAEGNSYASLSKFSIENSVVNYGMFKRTNLRNVLITNDKFDNSDTRLNLKNIQLLRLINIIFKDNDVTINDGLIYRSHFVNGEFNLGILYNCYWNGGIFKNGIFSNGSWVNGRFISGKFINSNQTELSTDYHQIGEFYKNWQNGTFETGDFANSVWLNGTFNNGRFLGSHFYGGVWNNGILGSKNLPMSNTTFGYYKKLEGIGTTVSIWNYGVVDNALLGGNGVVYWYDGKCNAGEFTSNGQTADNESIWYNGEFNGSKFTNLARWKNGVFNSGKFHSYYGWENVSPLIYSSTPSEYSWENGRFISGEFGYKGMTGNSTWYNGQFLGGEFMGRFWRNGNFISGNFHGSGLTKNIDSTISSEDEFNFANSFTESYYGLWAGGSVIDNEKNVQDTTSNICQINRVRGENSRFENRNKTNFNNILWLGGNFNHDNASFNNSLWLSGNFIKGEFNGGVFNPYVDREFTGSFTNSSFGSSASWRSGTFVTGSIFNSQWSNGVFKNGFMSGVVWQNGTFEYGRADNVYWIDGTWRNGNWNGSPFKYDLIITTQSDESGNTIIVNKLKDGREKDIILNISRNIFPSSDGQPPLHIMNIFSASAQLDVLNITNNNSNSLVATNSATSSWTYSVETYIGINSAGRDVELNKSEWSWSRNFNIVTSTQSGQLRVPILNANTDQTVGADGVDGAEGQSNSLSVGFRFVPAVRPGTISPSFDGHIVTSGGTNSFFSPIATIFGNNTNRFTDTPPSSKVYAKIRGGQDTNIFTFSSTNYTIEALVAVELVPSVEVEFFVGGLSSSIFELKTDDYRYTGDNNQEFFDYYARVYKISLLYITSDELLSRTDGGKLAIRKNSNGILRILNLSIKRKNIQYHPEYHNTLYRGGIDYQNNQISLPATSSVSLDTLSTSGFEVGANFGNGIFRRGIWENGLWNNGYRSSEWFPSEFDYIKASEIIVGKTFKVRGLNTWRITLRCLDSLNTIDPSKRISVGNLVNINVNGKRSYIREPLRITNIDTINSEITFEYISSFEVKNIEKDSANHLIYITQNIWQNGVFLNGYFKGIWSNGVFKGYPKTTQMVDSHWVTGYFEGGHFKSTPLLRNLNANLPAYNTGLIQNVTFKDRNIANPPVSSYESWMEISYSTFSNVNLNNVTNLIGVSNKTLRVIENYDYNLSGPPTSDVLSSNSFFRNSSNALRKRYTLGTKTTISNNLLKNTGDFNDPHSDTINFSFPVNTQLDRINKSAQRKNIFEQGWSYSYLSLYEWISTFSQSSESNNLFSGGVQYVVTSNTNASNNGKLNFNFRGLTALKNLNSPPTVTLAATQSDTVYFNLTNTKIQTLPNRYYSVEVIMDSLPQTQSFFYLSDTSQLSSNKVFRHNPQFNTSKTFTEFFYNTQGLDFVMEYVGSPVGTFSIEKISFTEVDSIPFFKYFANDNQIDFSIKNPYVGIAPIIDYTNKNFDFIGNVELGIDFRVIVNQNASVTRVGSATSFRYIALPSEPLEVTGNPQL
jgi:hypothetical protein